MRLRLGLLSCVLLSVAGLVVADADFASVRRDQTTNHNSRDAGRPRKYFHEATFDEHYDGRFGDRALSSDELHTRLSYLVQSFLITMNQLGAEAWLMHGGLRAWWWNHRAMPWDADLAAMITEDSLRELAGFHNMTVHRHHIPGLFQPRQYLLEVNPRSADSDDDPDNRVDARYIDMDVGLFIAVTTLRKDPSSSSTTPSWRCKDGTTYANAAIFPLRQTTFEGVPARIPAGYADLLEDEFGARALRHLEIEGKSFDMTPEQWIPDAQRVLKGDGMTAGAGKKTSQAKAGGV